MIEYQSPIASPLEPTVASALVEVERLSARLVAQVEDLSPGLRSGERKRQHMRAASEKAGIVAAELGLDPSEAALLRFLLRSHDISRHVQALGPLTAKDSIDHAEPSVQVLEENEILTGLH